MASIEVEVDLSDFRSRDIVDEVIERLSKTSWHRFTDADRIKIKQAFKIVDSIYLPQKTLEDISKGEVIREYWDKYTSSQLEQLLK